MPLQQTSGNATADAYGGGVAAIPIYIEDVFNIWLYTGNDTTQVITNGIDLATKGGLVWNKGRDSGTTNHILVDSARGTSSGLITNTTDAAGSSSGFTSFDTTGFTFGGGAGARNNNGTTYCSWTFRKQPKFFDIVTYTGDGVSSRRISHSLASTPGCIIVKRTSTTGNWITWHRTFSNLTDDYLLLNNTGAVASQAEIWGTSAPTSTDFGVGASSNNTNGATYVAYLFAHNAGGFGLTGTDNVISCGSYVEGGVGTEQTINLGYEAQWLLIKPSSVPGSWYIYDVMRGFAQTVNNYLLTNLANAEASTNSYLFKPAATGFIAPGDLFGSSANVIYIAIRRGPMKVPTDATKVFSPNYTSSSANPLTVTTNFPVDLSLNRATTASPTWAFSRLTGATSNVALLTTSVYLQTQSTAAESSPSKFGDSMQSNTALIDAGFNAGDSTPKIYWNFQRAPGFFDEVCYTGDGDGTQLVYHNLAAYPELVIIKRRNSTSNWMVNTLTSGSVVYSLGLNSTSGNDATSFQGTAYSAPTYIGVRTGSTLANISGATYVAYLFATCAGVSKVGTYTGNGTTQTIDCGFTSGARFVLIKRTDSTGDWYTYDTARGMTVLTDPYLLLNTTAAEVATLGSVTTVSTGFALNSTILAAINVNAGTYIFLAIA
jgi:hypothetical protein